jgi:type VI secretion system protein ImpA
LPTPCADPLANARADPACVGWLSRDDAYRTLEALAEFLGRIEPHSPTPYLIRRAVKWGRMPLPQLMADIMQGDGDLHRMVNLLGLQGDD